jgi:uncharacterized protein YjbJ (UPF0337 family)
MNWAEVSSDLKLMRSAAKHQWAKLTDDDLKKLDATKDMLVYAVQERYLIVKEEAERQVDAWVSKTKDLKASLSQEEPRPR